MNIRNIYAIYGDSVNPMHIPSAYQGDTSHVQNLGGINEYVLAVYPQLKYDSWLTLGITNGNINNKVSSVGIDFTSWNNGESIDIENGAVFLMDPTSIDASINGYEIVIGQITIATDTTATVTVNVQGKSNIQDKFNDGYAAMSWNEIGVSFPLLPITGPTYDSLPRPDSVPTNCISWFDGCNTCGSSAGVLNSCTRMMCFREDNPRCLQYAESGH
jgi:hypothetical protein